MPRVRCTGLDLRPHWGSQMDSLNARLSAYDHLDALTVHTLARDTRWWRQLDWAGGFRCRDLTAVTELDWREPVHLSALEVRAGAPLEPPRPARPLRDRWRWLCTHRHRSPCIRIRPLLYGRPVPYSRTTRWPGQDEIRLVPDASAGDELIQDAFHRIAEPLALQRRGPTGSACQRSHDRRRRCRALRQSGAGKSTLAYALSRRDHQLWGYDAVAFDLARLKVPELSLPWQRGPSTAAFSALLVVQRADTAVADEVRGGRTKRCRP